MSGGLRRLGGRRRLVGISGFTLTVALAAFHGQLLWQRLADGSLLQPIVATRWALSGLLAVVLLQLWSRGLPILRGRRAGVLWLIVALLHAFTPAAPLPAVEPVTGSLLPAVVALLTLLALGAVAAPVPGAAVDHRAADRRRYRPRRTGAGWYRILFSRPPPVTL